MEFAIEAIKLYKLLVFEKEFVLLKQFLRSATSIGANISEALGCLTGKDFAAKMAISNKEARETLFWIELLERSQFIKFDYTNLKERALELVRLLTAITKTAQGKYNPKARL